MSYAVVRVQKMTSGGVKGIEIHDRRKKEGVSHSNPDIDWTRSENNYDVHHAQNKNFNRAVKSRINSLNLPRAVRKDAVVMAQVLVTSDTAFFDQLRDRGGEAAVRKFFRDSYNFLADRYGKENIISSTVHLDERTPHMHFNFVPVTADNRLCAKEVTARAKIISLHDAFRDSVGQHYGLLRGDPKESGKRQTHLETAEYKVVMKEVEKEQARSAELKEKNDALDTAIDNKNREYIQKYGEYKQLFAEADKELRETLETKEGLLLEVNSALQERDKLVGAIESLTEEETALKGRITTVTDYYNKELLQSYHKLNDAVKRKGKELSEMNDFASNLLGNATLTELESSGRVETKKLHLVFGGMVCRNLDAAGVDHAITVEQGGDGRLFAQVSVRGCDAQKLDTAMERAKPKLAQRQAQQSPTPPNRGHTR